MTTKPKAKKFRVRRSAGAAAPAPRATPEAEEPANSNPPQGEVSSAREVDAETAIAEIRKEGLTGRQLRMARRVAQKQGLAATSDFDAVRLLRAKGIDPFQRTNVLDLVVAEGQSDAPGTAIAKTDPQLPKTVPQNNTLPSTELQVDDQRAGEIIRIQQDIASRRRRKLTLLFARLGFFVLLPTLLAGLYYYTIATPMYATKSDFIIKKSESQLSSGLGGMFGGSTFATMQDSIVVQSFLQSREAMLRLDKELGYKAHFAQDSIDAIQQLDPTATNEDAYKLYKRNVKISYDSTEGIIKMEVIAADPNLSQSYSEALIQYAEERVDQMSLRLREDQMRDSRTSFNDAQDEMALAQQSVIELQEKFKVLSPETDLSLLTSQISALETQLTQEELTQAELLANLRPNRAKLDPLERRIQTLKDKIAGLRAQLTETTAGGESLARISSELSVAQTNLETRTLMMQQALQQLEAARVEAQKQTLYLEVGVRPTAPDAATYPRKLENTILAMLIFSGIYLLVSLTTSILREQVSS